LLDKFLACKEQQVSQAGDQYTENDDQYANTRQDFHSVWIVSGPQGGTLVISSGR